MQTVGLFTIDDVAVIVERIVVGRIEGKSHTGCDHRAVEVKAVAGIYAVGCAVALIFLITEVTVQTYLEPVVGLGVDRETQRLAADACVVDDTFLIIVVQVDVVAQLVRAAADCGVK